MSKPSEKTQPVEGWPKYGFQIRGGLHLPRTLVSASKAFASCATCDLGAPNGKEAYLSAFTYGEDFRELLESTRSPAGFSGPCSADWLWWDIDNVQDLEQGREAATRLVQFLSNRFSADDQGLLIFFSGSKGFHVGLSTRYFDPEPSVDFNSTAKAFCKTVADAANVTIDPSIYDKVRPLRAPNSRHPKTGLIKRRLTAGELTLLDAAAIKSIAEHPQAFDITLPSKESDRAVADWQTAIHRQASKKEFQTSRLPVDRESIKPRQLLNQVTLDVIRKRVHPGNRHRLLFSAAADLAENGVPDHVIFGLLSNPGKENGLTQTDVERQIRSGIERGRRAGDN